MDWGGKESDMTERLSLTQNCTAGEGLGLENGFLDMTPKAQSTKEKID